METTYYPQSGRRVTLRCRCPKCGHDHTRCVATGCGDDGVMVRQRRCAACDATFWTAQEPEYLVPRRLIHYVGQKPALL